MAKIINRGNFSQIVDETDFQFLTTLDSHLSFTVPGAQYTRAFKGFANKKTGGFDRWDGTRRIMTDRLEFPSGLVPRVEEFFKSYSKQIEVVDQRPPKTPNNKMDIEAILKRMDKVPHDYQVQALEEAKKHDRGIIKLATGGGKSLIAAMIAAEYGKPTIVYVIGKDLLYQFYDLFKDIFGDKAGIIGDGLCRISQINVVSIWTVGQAMGLKKSDILLDGDDDSEKFNLEKGSEIINLLADAKVHIIDECHMAACATIQRLYKSLDNAEYIYGLSGSPWRDDNADLLIEALLGKYIVNIQASYLIQRGFLAKPIIRFMDVPKLREQPPNNYKSIYKAYIVENEDRNEMVLKAAKMLTGQGYQTLILFNSLAHGKILYDLIKDEIPCAILAGSDDKETRDQVKKDLMAGRLNCVLASKIFDIGVDIPSLSGLIVACGGKSTVKAIQRIGRVIRRYPGKKIAGIVDFNDNCKFLDKHSKIRFKVYKSEDGFEVHWPSKKKKR